MQHQRCIGSSCSAQQHHFSSATRLAAPWPSQLRSAAAGVARSYGHRAGTKQQHLQHSRRHAAAAGGRQRTVSVRANYDNMSADILGPHFHNRARITDEMMGKLMELPGTRGLGELRARAEDLTTWKLALQKGVLPQPEDVQWPVEPFKTKFMDALRTLEMPRFTRRYPAVLDTLMKQMLNMVHDFEAKLLEAESKRQQQQQQQRPQQQQQQSQQGQEQQDQQEGESGEEGQAGGMTEQQMEDLTQEQLEQALKDSMSQQGQQGKGSKQIQIGLQEMEGQQAGKTGEGGQEVEDEALAKEVEAAAEQIVAEFQQGMQEVMDNLEKAQMAFDDLSELLEGEEGFALSQGTWQRDGWRELDDLRKKLEGLKELRELVRGLGRSGGKGPLRKAPEQVESPKHPVGVVRSPLQPEEVRGLTRGGELSRMLPSEMALLAHGWPRRVSDNPEGAAAAAAAGGMLVSTSLASAGSQDEEGALIEEQYYLPGAHAARMLHRVRRAERMLLSYERCGWLDDTPSRLTGRQEIRPAAEMGPIILCLDTSGSMRGAREVVAKALALECMRGAHRQQRPCYLYAFSGPDQVQELELSVDLRSLDKLLDFLSCSFAGGTDVDKPLQLSLERLQKDEWQQADILMVTDGEIAPPKQELLDDIAAAHEDMGLEVHGLIVSSQLSESMQKLCTHLHVFKSWSAVGGEAWQY